MATTNRERVGKALETLRAGLGPFVDQEVQAGQKSGVIDDAMYTRAMKQRSAYGWRKVEPSSTDRSLPAPRFLRRATSKAEILPSRLAEQAHLPEDVVLRIAGKQKPSLIH